jgi:hypothetical protein
MLIAVLDQPMTSTNTGTGSNDMNQPVQPVNPGMTR